MKQGWKEETLGEIGKVSMCKRILKKQTNDISGIPFYKIGTFGKRPNAFISEEIYNEFKEKYSFPKKGDILLSASGTIGRRVIYDGKPAYFQDSNIVWIDNDEKKVLNEYLYVFYGFCNWNPSKGTTISRLYNDDLRRIPIPIPPIEEQKQIVEILDKTFESIEQAKVNIEKNIENAKELFQSRLNEIFSQKGDGWEEKKLGKVWKTGAGGTPLKSKKEYYENGNIPWLCSGEVKQGNIYSSNKFITQKGLDNSSAKLFPKDTVVIAMYGATAGDVGILRFETSTNQAVCGILPNDILIPEFIYYSFSYRKNELIAQATGNAQPNISQIKIKNTLIPILEKKEQLKIIEELDSLKEQTKQLENHYKQKLKNLEELKKSILQKAFSGELLNDS